MIHVLSPGLLTTVQDAGRWGHQHRGVPVAGPMDPFAFARANGCVGNATGAAALEITLTGPRLRFARAATIACCGAETAMRVDGILAVGEGPHLVPDGAEVDVGRMQRGARCYLAVAGGIDVPIVLGSRATHLPGSMGGVEGRALRAGDVLAIGTEAADETTQRSVVALPPPATVTVLHVLPGPERDRFGEAAWRGFLATVFSLQSDSNRMGYRLAGRTVPAPVADGVSTAITMGTVQVPGSGSPILLMADRQTTGGYPRLAQVIAADLGLAGQLKPGDRLRFALCTPEYARLALLARTSLAPSASWDQIRI